MVWKVELDPSAEKELSKLDRQVAIRILSFLNDRLAKSENPRLLGQSLKAHLEEYWKYRIGDYRIICKILDNVLTIIVIRVGDRKHVYKLK